ncbi:hypothetical protein [Bacteroides cellulosilyticus]|uniref:hypothetical protein n=1 Tax=Bacteroides cellulosilyticus TaxID=246787 RepID=UPI002FD8BBEF
MFILLTKVTDGLWNVSVTTQYSSNRTTVKVPRTYQMNTRLSVGTAYKQPEDGNEGEEGGEALNTLP